MPIPVHVICGKCGSLDVRFEIDPHPLGDCGVRVKCKDCATLTGVEEINEWKEEQFGK